LASTEATSARNWASVVTASARLGVPSMLENDRNLPRRREADGSVPALSPSGMRMQRLRSRESA
jgi:hypothetical protein